MKLRHVVDQVLVPYTFSGRSLNGVDIITDVRLYINYDDETTTTDEIFVMLRVFSRHYRNSYI